LNHVVRKWSTNVDRSANHLIPVPGGADGPSGVLVCSEEYITWYHPEYNSIKIPMPTRHDPLTGPKKTIIISSIVHKLKKNFFILLQTELGDVFKLTMDFMTGIDGVIGQVANIRLKYFETLSPAGISFFNKWDYVF
jgi:splicing factor 3B subunit 3